MSKKGASVLKGTDLTIYPLQISTKVCPICGKPLRENCELEAQAGRLLCVKLPGAACDSCAAFFTQGDDLTPWLQCQDFYQHIRDVNDAYNKRIDISKHQNAFEQTESIFRLFLLMRENAVRVVLITSQIDDEDPDNRIVHYTRPVAQSLLQAEKAEKRHVTIDGKTYTIIQIDQKPVDSEKYIINQAEQKPVDEKTIQENKRRPTEFPTKLPDSPFSLVPSKTTVYVYRSRIANHKYHTTEEIRVRIKNLEYDWLFYAEYCYDCDMFLLKYEDYERYLKKYKFFPCRVDLDERINKKGNYKNRADESEIHLQGYNVSQKDGLSLADRQNMLRFFVDMGGAEKKREILDLLEMLIQTNGRKPENWKAREKWEEDKEWLCNYKAQSLPEFDVIIEPYKRKIVLK